MASLYILVEMACKRIHEMLEGLPKWCEPSDELPINGIYFFYEKGEINLHTRGLRITRVGTHGTRPSKRVRNPKRALKNRLKHHYDGNREGSVFRKHLGSALLKMKSKSENEITEWHKGRKSPLWGDFEEVEREVNHILRSNFFFRVISVDKMGERKVFEEKLIASLSSCTVCKPSKHWLGKFALNEKVKKSGLWNSNYVDSSARLTEKDLKRLKKLTR